MTNIERAAAAHRHAVSEHLEAKLMNARPHPKTHAIIAAMLGLEPYTPAKYVGKAICTSDGFLQCNFVGADGRSHHSAFVGSLSELNEALDDVATVLELSTDEIEQLDQLLADWIVIDYRS